MKKGIVKMVEYTAFYDDGGNKTGGKGILFKREFPRKKKSLDAAMLELFREKLRNVLPYHSSVVGKCYLRKTDTRRGNEDMLGVKSANPRSIQGPRGMLVAGCDWVNVRNGELVARGGR